MTEHDDGNIDQLQKQLETLELAFRANGVLGEIAQGAVANGHELEPQEVADVLLPPKQPGDAYQARWQLVEGAPDSIKAATNERSREIFGLAEQLGMRKGESLIQSDLERIDPANAVWVVEGGANRTSVVRRELVLQAMRALYGNEVEAQVVYQFGSDRPIPQERNGNPNPEYVIAQEIGGDNLPAEDTLDEFKLNLASALQAGYTIAGDESASAEGVKQVLVLQKQGYPTLKLLEPEKEARGLHDGFTSVTHLEGNLEGRQFVIGTNGQYRPKDELQARQWAANHSVEMLPAVALGDEPGFAVEHNGREITTAERAATAYVNEMVILKRLAKN
jgi:hypothetical protein